MNTKSILTTGVLLLASFALQAGPGSEEITPKSDGFIRDWLLLAPIQLPADTDGAMAIDKNQIADEGQLKPKAGDKFTVAGKEFVWKKIKAGDYFLDFNALVKQQTEKTVAYAVAYIRSDEERTGLQLKMGSNDQGKVYLNGKPVLKATDARAMEQDADVARNVTLNKGVNVVVFKVFNEGGEDWQGCLRFTETNGKGVANLFHRLEP